MLTSYRPPPPLSDFVDQLWIFEGSTWRQGKERVLPTGSMQLVVNLGEGDSGGPILCGAYSESFVIEMSSQASLIGVHFRPGGAFPFLPLTMGELHNRHAPLSDLWGRSAACLKERLMEARTRQQRFQDMVCSLIMVI
jgi:hypothetical protein